jgi:hypothetical protein
MNRAKTIVSTLRTNVHKLDKQIESRFGIVLVTPWAYARRRFNYTFRDPEIYYCSRSKRSSWEFDRMERVFDHTSDRKPYMTTEYRMVDERFAIARTLPRFLLPFHRIALRRAFRNAPPIGESCDHSAL